MRAEVLGDRADGRTDVGMERVAVLGVLDGEAEDRLQREGAVVAQQSQPGRHGPGHGRREQPRSRDQLQPQVLERLDRRGGGGDPLTRQHDGLSAVAIYTPNSYGQYRLLARDGLDTVLRGDEATSYGAPAASLSEALKLVSLRSVEQVGGLAQLLHPDRREAVVAASREAISAVRAEAEGLSPAQARDTIGFEHHLQTFLASSAAYKSVFLAHRAPLLDYGLLELMEFVSDEERSDKRLFLRTMSRRYPKLFAMDFAKRWSTLEDWAAMLSGPTSARSYLLGQLQDSSSGFWELMDRAAVQELMIRIEADASGSSGPARRGLRRLALRLRGAASRHLGRRLRASLSAQQAYRPRPHVLMLRLIALKDWHDRLRVAPLAIGWESPAHPPGGEPASFELATS